MKIKIEYVWLDGYRPEPNLRSKIKVIDFDDDLPQFELRDVPQWSFDGSSTQQAEGHFSDCVLNPVRLYFNPFWERYFMNSYIVFCEVLNPDGTPHRSNTRSLIQNDDEDNWFGFEQEYVLRGSKDQEYLPLGFHNFPDQEPEPQGKYYCSVGYPYSAGRKISEEHLDACILAGIKLTGTNAEVMLGQWEYQVFSQGNKKAGDDLWVSRFLLMRVAEKYNVRVDFHPKPMGKDADWNGSGMHVNFSNSQMRETGGKELFDFILESMKKSHEGAILIYGHDNHLRLTGKHETQSITKFSWGVSDRGASVRIPLSTAEKWMGYLEDRRPGSNADPYLITSYIGNVLSLVTEEVHRE
jgi:glutamine synthetase